MPIQPAYLIYGIVEDEGTVSIVENRDKEEIRYKDIAAIVGKVEMEDGKEPGKEDLQRWLVGHQETTIDIFQHRTLLPLRFGVIFGSQEEVKDFLVACYLHIKMAMTKVRGKAEFVVQLFWDLKAALEEIYWSEQKPKGDRNLVEIGRLLFQAAERKREEIVNAVLRKLSVVSLDSSEAKLNDETMIINRSYLIERTAEGIFDQVMQELGKENHSYLRFKYVGPLPPYSFVPLEFRRGNFDLIERARNILSLPDRARFGEVKASYRALSLKYHPDRNPGDRGSEERFKEIAAAFEILEAYCLSSRITPLTREDSEYSFRRDEVERAFIVS